MGNFFAELKRRHIYRIAAAYTVVAWVALQLVNNLAPAFKLPDWSVTFVVVLLAVGFPFALIFAWLLDVKTPNAAAPKTGSGDWALAGVAVAMIAMLAYQEFAPSEPGTATLSSLDAARIAAARPAGISVAVLPFENLSGDASQEFFSDGMTQEIIAALAKIPDLRVVARGSASQFKGERKDLRSVGQALGATHLIEGSVRKAGTRVRITAQLVKADDDVNIWVNSYDREMNDVFAVQEDIATSIAGALRMPLGLKPGEQLISNRAIDPKSYEQFLRGKIELLKGRGAFAEQIAILEPVVARNPNYAPAWSALAHAYFFAVSYYEITARQTTTPDDLLRSRDAYLPKANAAAQRAVELNPESADGLMAELRIQAWLKKWARAEDFAAKALIVDPSNPDVLSTYGNGLMLFGKVKEAVAMLERLHESEPFIPIYAGNRALALWLNGQTDAAIAVVKENLGRPGSGSGTDLPRIYASLGRYEEAADLISQFPTAVTRNVAPTAAALMRSAPTKTPAPESLPPLGNLGFVYFYTGTPDRMLDYYEQGGAALDIAYLWHPSYAVLRKTERFKKIVRDWGLVDYWKARGWPDLCRPMGADDFVCD